MKFIIAFAAVVAVAAAAAVSDVQLLRSENFPQPDGSYKFAYELSDKQSRDESGQLVSIPGDETPAVVVTGTYSYVGDDGQTYSVRYSADHNGYHAEGAHLPVAPQV